MVNRLQFSGILLRLLVWGILLVTISFHSTGWAMKMIGSVEKKHHPKLLIIALIVAFLIVAILLRKYAL